MGAASQTEALVEVAERFVTSAILAASSWCLPVCSLLRLRLELARAVGRGFLQRRMRGECSPFFERSEPFGNILEKLLHGKRAVLSRIQREIAAPPPQKRASPDCVSRGMVMKADGQLNQPLQELLLRNRGGAPNVLPNLMGVIKAPLVEQRAAMLEVVDMGTYLGPSALMRPL
jgi:hypothetical protein